MRQTGVAGEVTLGRFAGTHGGEELDGLANIAQCAAAVRHVENAVDLRRERGCVSGQQYLAAGRLARDACRKVHRGADVVAIALDRRTVMEPNADAGAPCRA
jgi:hypothetical protein